MDRVDVFMGDETRERGRRAREKSFRCPYSGTIISTVSHSLCPESPYILYVTGDACVRDTSCDCARTTDN